MANGEEIEDINVAEAPSGDSGFVLVPYDPEPRRDYVRAIVTIVLVLAFLGLLIEACVASFATKDHWDQTKEMLQILLPALTGLLGSALGFYFGASSGQGK
jgi:hypothetical protein